MNKLFARLLGLVVGLVLLGQLMSAGPDRALRRLFGGGDSKAHRKKRPTPTPPPALTAMQLHDRVALAPVRPDPAVEWTCPYPRKRISCYMRERVIENLRNNVLRVCLWDGNSAMHADRISQHMPPPERTFSWERNCDVTHPDSLFGMGSYWPGWFINQLTAYPANDSYKILLATEPPVVQPELYPKMRELQPQYDLVLSLADMSVLNGSNVLQWSFGSSHVPLHEWRSYPKTKLCSIIASKQDWAPGHKLRHAAIARMAELGFSCDSLGRGYLPIEAKLDGHRDYMFSLVIENSISGRYMTEKLFDALAAGTVPLYWGTPYAKLLFGEGPGAPILYWDTLEDLERLLPRLNADLYARMLPAVEKAREKAIDFVPPERWLWKNIFECAYKWHAANGDCRSDEEVAAARAADAATRATASAAAAAAR